MSPTSGSEWAATLAVAGFSLAILPSLPRARTWARTVVVAMALWLSVRYLGWRLMETVRPADPLAPAGVWVWVVFFFELAAIVNSGVTYLMLTRTSDHTAAADRHERRLRSLPESTLPRVDVFLCTFNEGLDVLEGPIIAAKSMDYPNFTVWVLDDGRRPWLRDFCENRKSVV